jgi:hypothetical protein
MFEKEILGIEITKPDCTSQEYSHSYAGFPGVTFTKPACTSHEYSRSWCRSLRRKVWELRSPSWTASVMNTVTLVQVFEKEGPGVKITKPACTSQEYSHSCAGV